MRIDHPLEKMQIYEWSIPLAHLSGLSKELPETGTVKQAAAAAVLHVAAPAALELTCSSSCED